MCIGKSTLRLGENIFGAVLRLQCQSRKFESASQKRSLGGNLHNPGNTWPVLQAANLWPPGCSFKLSLLLLRRSRRCPFKAASVGCAERRLGLPDPKEGGEGSAKASLAGRMAEKRVSRWYFGGLASCGAACCTHPLDLLKVRPGKGGKQGRRTLSYSAACPAADVRQAAVGAN